MVTGPNGQVYLRSPNIGRNWPPKTTPDKVKGDLHGRIVDRKSMGIYQGQDLMDRHEIDWERFLYHFLVRYIIGAGDSGPWNFINNYGIDYEEDRTPDSEPPTNLLQVMFKKPQSTKYATLIMQAVKNMRVPLKKKIETVVLPYTTGQEVERVRNVCKLLGEPSVPPYPPPNTTITTVTYKTLWANLRQFTQIFQYILCELT